MDNLSSTEVAHQPRMEQGKRLADLYQRLSRAIERGDLLQLSAADYQLLVLTGAFEKACSADMKDSPTSRMT